MIHRTAMKREKEKKRKEKKRKREKEKKRKREKEKKRKREKEKKRKREKEKKEATSGGPWSSKTTPKTVNWCEPIGFKYSKVQRCFGVGFMGIAVDFWEGPNFENYQTVFR